MIHMIQNAKDQVAQLTMTAYQTAVAAGKLPEAQLQRAPVEIPKDTKNRPASVQKQEDGQKGQDCTAEIRFRFHDTSPLYDILLCVHVTAL